MFTREDGLKAAYVASYFVVQNGDLERRLRVPRNLWYRLGCGGGSKIR